MISEIRVPQKGEMWSALCAPVIAMARAINGLRNLRFEASPDSDWHFLWDAGGALIQYGAGSGSGGDGGKLYLFNGVANGGTAFYLLAGDGVAYTTIPAGYGTPVNPD